MNANHARPMLAFWLLAIAAAAITAAGLRTSAPGVTVRSGSPSAVSTSATPDLLLGSSFRPVPSGAATAAASGPVVSAAALEYATRIATARPQVTVRPPTRSPSKSAATSQSARATTTPTASPTAGPGRHQGESHGPTTTSTTTATTTSGTSPGKGHQAPGSDHAGSAPGKSGAH